MPPLRLLILGGTTEASRLAAALAGRGDVAATLSLAGRTRNPAPSPLPVRTGGFGGAEGLARYIALEKIGAVVDATHPFAPRISANAARACALTGVPLAAFTRAPWTPRAGDSWDEVADLPAAAAAIGEKPAAVFLTTGRLGLAAFKAAPQHRYLLRSIDPPDASDLPMHCETVLARGPFDVEAEAALMRANGIEVLVTKNSGGEGAKLDAARGLGIRVVMVARPQAGAAQAFTTLAAVLGWIADHRPAP